MNFTLIFISFISNLIYMSIFSPINGLSEKEEFEHYLGKKISKNEYSNFVTNVNRLNKTISENPKVFNNIISGLISETEVKPSYKLTSPSSKLTPPSSKLSEELSNSSKFKSAKAKSVSAMDILDNNTQLTPSLLDSIRNSSPGSNLKAPKQDSVQSSNNTSKSQLTPSFLNSIRNSSPESNLKSPKQASVQSSNNNNKLNPQQKSMLTTEQQLANRRRAIDGNDSDNEFAKKYYTQTAGMEQKYLKYKNKYLSLKQKLSV